MKKHKPAPVADTNSLEDQIKALKEKHARSLADYQNLEKRVKDQQSSFVRLANAGLIASLIEVLDNLQTAATHLDDQGINMIITRLKTILESEGLEEINTKDKTFDPLTMECIDTVPGKKDQVVEVVNKGYALNDTIIRPAKVKVGGGK